MLHLLKRLLFWVLKSKPYDFRCMLIIYLIWEGKQFKSKSYE